MPNIQLLRSLRQEKHFFQSATALRASLSKLGSVQISYLSIHFNFPRNLCYVFRSCTPCSFASTYLSIVLINFSVNYVVDDVVDTPYHIVLFIIVFQFLSVAFNVLLTRLLHLFPLRRLSITRPHSKSFRPSLLGCAHCSGLASVYVYFPKVFPRV